MPLPLSIATPAAAGGGGGGGGGVRLVINTQANAGKIVAIMPDIDIYSYIYYV
jgi:hypothetical protein